MTATRLRAASRRARRVVWAVALLAPITLATAARAQSVPDPGDGYVHDFASILSDDVENELEAELAAFERDTTNEVAVVTIDTLGGADLEEYSLELANRWGVGRAGRDNGVVLLVAQHDRELRIEVGRGLEGTLTDDVARSIVDDEIVPALRAGDYDRGVSDGVASIVDAIEGEYSPPPSGDESWVTVVAIAVVAALGGFALWGSRRSGGWWGGAHASHHVHGTTGAGSTGGSSGSGGFGGGSFGGGGASGGW